jgi:hypothetical protein
MAAAAEVAPPGATPGAAVAVVSSRNHVVEPTASASATTAKKPKAIHAPVRPHVRPLEPGGENAGDLLPITVAFKLASRRAAIS